LQEAYQALDKLKLPPGRRLLWATLLERLFDAGDAGLSADDIAQVAGTMGRDDFREAGSRVLDELHEMTRARLVDQGLTFGVLLRVEALTSIEVTGTA